MSEQARPRLPTTGTYQAVRFSWVFLFVLVILVACSAAHATSVLAGQSPERAAEAAHTHGHPETPVCHHVRGPGPCVAIPAEARDRDEPTFTDAVAAVLLHAPPQGPRLVYLATAGQEPDPADVSSPVYLITQRLRL